MKKEGKRIIAFNIAYNNGTLSNCPIIWHENIKGFSKSLRRSYNIKALFKWAKKNHVPPSLLKLNVSIIDGDYSKEFTIRLINVREYKKYWESIYTPSPTI